MPNTYYQIRIHVIFSVRSRQSLIQPEWEKRLYQYIIALFEKRGQKVLAINGTSDHIHIFIGQTPAQSLSKLIQQVKTESSAWIRRKKLSPSTFRWQRGFAAFSYARSQTAIVCRYIERQKEHHAQKTQKEELMQLLDAFEVDFREEYLPCTPQEK